MVYRYVDTQGRFLVDRGTCGLGLQTASVCGDQLQLRAKLGHGAWCFIRHTVPYCTGLHLAPADMLCSVLHWFDSRCKHRGSGPVSGNLACIDLPAGACCTSFPVAGPRLLLLSPWLRSPPQHPTHLGVLQETLAKLHLRDGVNRQLWGLQLAGPTNPGAEITSELAKVCEWGGL